MRKKQLVTTALAGFAPVLLAVSPIVHLFQRNQPDLAAGVLALPLLVAVVFAAVLFVVLRLLLKSDSKASALASLAVFGIFYYGTFADLVSGWGSESIFFAVWVVLMGLGIFALSRTKNPRNVGIGVFVLALCLAVVPGYQAAAYAIKNHDVSPHDTRLWSGSLGKPAVTTSAALPDIYVLFADDYTRPDVLEQYFGYDDTPFLQELRKRGFVVPDKSRSAYSDSESNMASALNLDYLSQFGKVLGETSTNGVIVKQVLEDNRAARFLEPLGYRYVHIDSDNTTFAGANPDISALAAPDNFTYLWLHGSILRAFGGPIGFSQGASDSRFARSVLRAFDRLDAVPSAPGRKFVVFHTLIPHDPYVFGPQGERVTFPNPGDVRLGAKDAMSYYIGQLQFMNTKLLASIDRILAASKTPPIILLLSDEGFSADSGTVGEEAAADIRVKGLTALYLPGKDTSRVPADLINVNVLRYVFDEYLGTNLGMLPNASYPESDYPYQAEQMHVIGDPTSGTTQPGAPKTETGAP